MHGIIYIYAHICIFTHTYLYYVYMLFIYTHIQLHTYIYSHTHYVSICIYTNTCPTHSLTHTHTYIYTNRKSAFFNQSRSLWQGCEMSSIPQQNLRHCYINRRLCDLVLNKRLDGLSPYIAYLSFHSNKSILRLYLRDTAIWMRTEGSHSLSRCFQMST